MEPNQIIPLVNLGAGVAALVIVFWMFIKEIPAQRVAREKLQERIETIVEKSQVHIDNIVREFRDELQRERHACASERALDRNARHATANALGSVSFALQLMAAEHPEHADAMKSAMESVSKDMNKASEANGI